MLEFTCARVDFCKKVKNIFKGKISRNLENTWGKPLNIVCLTTIGNFGTSC